MIIVDLFKHQWQKTFRAPGFYKNLWITILMAFMALYLVGALMLFGSIFPSIAEHIMPQYTPVEVLSGGLIYVVLFSLAMRFFFQSLGTINLQPYQILPIKRKAIVNYVMLKPLLNPANYLTLAFVFSFSVRSALSENGSVLDLQLIVVAILLIWFNVLMASYLKRRFSVSLLGFVGVLLVFVAIAALEYFGLFSLFAISKIVFGFVLSIPFGFVFLFLLPLGAYFLNTAFFRKNYYPESFNKRLAKKETYSQQFSFMDRFGKMGELIRLYIITFWRNKRLKSSLWVIPFILLYGMIFYRNDAFPIIIWAIFITGFPMILIGQYTVMINSTHFDAIMSKSLTAREYLQSFYYLMLFLSVATFIITTPYFLYGKEVVIAQTVAFLYNTGVNIPILLFFSAFNNNRFELNTGGAFNYQGVSMKSFLVLIPILIVPGVIMGITTAFGISYIGYSILGVMGVLGIALTKPILAGCERQFLRKKYSLCEGFRKKE